MATNRSRGNPSITLLDAVADARTIRESLGQCAHTREEIAERFRYTSATSGPAVRRLAASGHFGLLEKVDGGFAISDLANRILDQENAGEDTTEDLRKAFNTVSVFREYLAIARAHGGISESQLSDLIELGIAENAAEDVAAILMESARQAKIITADGKLIRAAGPEESGAREELMVAVPVFLPNGRIARIVRPIDLDRLDLEFLRNQIDEWQKVLESSKGVSPVPFRKRSAGS